MTIFKTNVKSFRLFKPTNKAHSAHLIVLEISEIKKSSGISICVVPVAA